MSGQKKPVNIWRDFGQAASAKPQRRRRSAAKTFSIRLSDEERALLAREAGKLSLAAHIRGKILGDTISPGRSRIASPKRPAPTADHVALGRVLALLGQSELSRNLDAIAKAAVMGALPVSPEVVQELHAACASIRAMRDALLGALGVNRNFENDSGR